MGFYVSDSEGRYIIGTAPAPLTTLPCELCDGEGYLGTADPLELAPCPACDGTGEGAEVCAGCLQVPTVEGGLEHCGCRS